MQKGLSVNLRIIHPLYKNLSAMKSNFFLLMVRDIINNTGILICDKHFHVPYTQHTWRSNHPHVLKNFQKRKTSSEPKLYENIHVCMGDKKHRVAPFDNILYSIKGKSSVKFNFNKSKNKNSMPLF